tara:strand:+ start:108 stop:908 length:801 start_codon:yes stop_codon:yes gene_type:complete
MAYIGNQPTDNFITFATQNFSTSATSSYTLDHAVSNENEIALFINNVRQHPGSGKAYTATGTALTLSENTASTDVMYCIFLGRAIQSTVPSTNSITPSMLGTTTVTALTAGTGITGGTGTVYRSDVQKLGNIFHTRILIDLTGLASSGSGDIIGKAATANSHIGQITAAINGTVLGGKLTCLEAPAGGDPDINLWYADEATGTEDAAITGLSNQVQMCDSGDLALGSMVSIPTPPAADKYMYMVTGAATDANYTAGKLLIEFFGYE